VAPAALAQRAAEEARLALAGYSPVPG